MRTLDWAWILLLCVTAAGCKADPWPMQPSALPSASSESAPVLGTPDRSLALALIGPWRGTLHVESSHGTPDCVAPFWQPGFVEPIDVVIAHRPDVAFSGSDLDLHLLPRASEAIHLAVGESATGIRAAIWPFLEDCPLVPGTCGLEGHFRLESSTWGCSGAPPEVWLTGVALTAAFTDESQRTLRGTMEIAYDHQPGCSRCGPPWTEAVISKQFEISKHP